MECEKLLQQLKKINEAKGYYFNKDMSVTRALIQGLITNRERYGYMCCPCRMAKEDAAADRDIICPCEYREPDVAAFGSCYCGLYVSQAWNEGRIKPTYVPERRPTEKC